MLWISKMFLLIMTLVWIAHLSSVDKAADYSILILQDLNVTFDMVKRVILLLQIEHWWCSVTL